MRAEAVKVASYDEGMYSLEVWDDNGDQHVFYCTFTTIDELDASLKAFRAHRAEMEHARQLYQAGYGPHGERPGEWGEGTDNIWDALLTAGDLARKARKENP